MKASWLVLFVLPLLIGPAAVQAQLVYVTNADGMTLTITGYIGPPPSVLITPTNIIIPTNIDGLTVTGIGGYAFYGPFDEVTNVSIPGSVISIGGSAFGGEIMLISATIANGVKSIDDSAFYDCGNLSSLTISDTLTNIGEDAFEWCGSLTNVAIPGSVITIEDGAFAESGLTSVTIANGVTSIGSRAFDTVGSVTIPASVTNIGVGAFGGCVFTVDSQNLYYSSVNGVLFDKSQTTLLAYPDSLGASYTIPGSVTSIGDLAFDYCTSLTNITIPDSVTNIGEAAFDSSGLINVTIPSSVANIGDAAFVDCGNLTRVYFKGNAPVVNSNLFLADENATVYYSPGTTGWGSPFAGLPAVLWNPMIQAGGKNFGLKNNQFGFNITGTANIPVVVEACTNLANPVWLPLQTVSLTNGLYHFSEPFQPGAPGRFYRVAFP
jgi:hypothetical protein